MLIDEAVDHAAWTSRPQTTYHCRLSPGGEEMVGFFCCTKMRCLISKRVLYKP